MKVAIIGAGIMGASIAFTLAKHGVEVHIFDKNVEVNDVTLYSLAWINAFNTKSLDEFLFYNLGLHRWPWFNKEIGGGCDLTWGGALSLPYSNATNKNLQTQFQKQLKWGYAMEALDRRSILQLEPNLELNENINFGIYCRDEGYVNAGKVTRKLLQLAQQTGAKLYRAHTVSQLMRKNGTIYAIRINEQAYRFDYVILAAGTAAATLAATAEITLTQQAIPYFIIETAPQLQRFRKISTLHILSDHDHQTNLRLRQNPIGSYWIVASENHRGFTDPKDYANVILQQVSELLPSAKNLQHTYRTVTVPALADNKSIFGFAPQVNNLYIALSPRAVVIASQIGDWIKEEILNHTPIHWLEQFRLKV